MKLFVISDTHGNIDQAVEIYKKLKDIDLIIHLGDYGKDAKNLENRLGVSVLSVKGNMDGAFSQDGYRILDTVFGKIFLAHGHMENVKQNLQTLLYKAESMGCKAAFFGHTHVPLFEDVEGMYLLNPGSLTLPTGGRKGSYAVVTLSEEGIEAFIGYEEIQQKRKTEYGFLSNLLNQSDRF
ncbi:YfcE family phosphodiesterase [Sinanaerobacter chloroacetimidivorans]|uniref:Phosphoesterase n=1 Tax=Sinanaerobacter chloroacetimidivorans TaxID=2818044 RepID=A0A8J7W1Q0_9FIRM|nr:metallophosphoesterase [Sinanaerobacter chloroacetimidivorans]MBR0597290.1 metallophosphoesterase [Sinanaerobacter chloroacetimidivorans]